ncbi:hypothetical protein ACTQ1D_03915 [Parafannyhessea umbonata]|uniref:hypothetical protein n=1 Tax=Parafannyhessea umbonata TaxID=604330 RepID=UPI003F96BA44
MIDKWQFDSLKVMLAFKTHIGITDPEWTQADADTLEQYCDALMQSTCQMDSGQRKVNRNEAGTLVSFDDIPQILNQIACLACWQVLAGAHKPKKEGER